MFSAFWGRVLLCVRESGDQRGAKTAHPDGYFWRLDKSFTHKYFVCTQELRPGSLVHTQEVTGSSPVAPTINLSAFNEWFGPAGLQYPLEILLSEQQALSKQATNEPGGQPPEGHPHRQRVRRALQ